MQGVTIGIGFNPRPREGGDLEAHGCAESGKVSIRAPVKGATVGNF